MVSFAKRQAHADSALMTQILDAGIVADRAKQKSRSYLGGSRLGEACLRALFYEYKLTPKDPGSDFDGKTLRIFDRGTKGEDRVLEYLKMAGFSVVTRKADGGQIGIYILPDEEGRARIAGHIDGVVVGWSPFWPEGQPAPISDDAIAWAKGIKYPALWENKILGSKAWGKLDKEGLKKSKPVYYAQMQFYMAYLDLHANPGIFTAENADTCDVYVERVPFDAAAAQEASDKGVKVVTASNAAELPRVTSDPSDFRCAFCAYRVRCWAEKSPTQTDQPVSLPWLTGRAG